MDASRILYVSEGRAIVLAEAIAADRRWVALVGHDAIGRVLIALLLELPLRRMWRSAQDNGGVDVVEVLDGEVVIRSVNATAHLRDIAPSGSVG